MSKTRGFSDVGLLDCLRQARPPDEAVRFIYKTYFRMCSSVVIKGGGNHQDAEDIFQEAVVSFIEMVRSGRFRAESAVSSMLFSITRNLWLNEIRRRGRAEKRAIGFEVSKESPGPGQDFVFAEKELSRKLLEQVDELGDTCKAILLAFYFEELPMREILPRFGFLNEQVLRNRKYKCMRQLEEKLKANPEILDFFKTALYHE
jgi:RNA polymerase sigma factor (sigma-70 family)